MRVRKSVFDKKCIKIKFGRGIFFCVCVILHGSVLHVRKTVSSIFLSVSLDIALCNDCSFNTVWNSLALQIEDRVSSIVVNWAALFLFIFWHIQAPHLHRSPHLACGPLFEKPARRIVVSERVLAISTDVFHALNLNQ